MKKLLCLPALLFVILITTPALAITLSLEPANQNIPLGGTAVLDLNISGLTAGGPDSLGAFALDITYDDTTLAFESVSFGSYLGDTSLFEADTYFDDSTPGLIYLDEVSWLFDYELDALQPDSFTLATLTFTGISLGSSAVEMENVVLSDTHGFVLPDPALNNANVTPVPEPATMILLGTGLAGLGVFGRKKFRKQLRSGGLFRHPGNRGAPYVFIIFCP